MLPRAAPPLLRTAIRPRTLQTHILLRQNPLSRRSISWRLWTPKDKPEPLPVYFAKSQPTLTRRILRSAGRGIGTALIFYACWQFFAALVIDPLLDWSDEEYEKASEQEKKEMDAAVGEDDEILFLPFPFTTKSVDQPPYKGSDPEWEMFVAVNRDKNWQKDIRTGLQDLIIRGLEKNPSVMKVMGGNLKKGKSWLDIQYPPRPPPKHMVSGITIDDSGIFWSEQPIDTIAANRVDMALYPKAVALTAWTFIDVLISTTFQDIASSLGFSTSQPVQTPWQTAIIKRMGEMGGSPTAPGGTFKPPTADFPGQGGSMFPSQTSQSSQITGATIGGSETALDPRVMKALHAANITFKKHWRSPKEPATRGCIKIDGLVEFHGNAGIMVIIAWAHYDPKAKKYIGVTMALKHMIPRKQTPQGGR